MARTYLSGLEIGGGVEVLGLRRATPARVVRHEARVVIEAHGELHVGRVAAGGHAVEGGATIGIEEGGISVARAFWVFFELRVVLAVAAFEGDVRDLRIALER